MLMRVLLVRFLLSALCADISRKAYAYLGQWLSKPPHLAA
jgi:hypothetical protein